MLTKELCLEYLRYTPEEGLTRLATGAKLTNKQVRVAGHYYTTTEVIWLMVYGVRPSRLITSRSGNTKDLRLGNLVELPEVSVEATQASLHRYFDLSEGEFTVKELYCHKLKVGHKIGSKDSSGYLTTSVGGKQFKVHHLVWLYVYGELPSMALDHINGIVDDNRPENLRLATKTQNSYNREASANNTSGYKGVSWFKPHRLWKAQIVLNGVSKHLGYFSDPQTASTAYEAYAKENHGEFYRAP